MSVTGIVSAAARPLVTRRRFAAKLAFHQKILSHGADHHERMFASSLDQFPAAGAFDFA